MEYRLQKIVESLTLEQYELFTAGKLAELERQGIVHFPPIVLPETAEAIRNGQPYELINEDLRRLDVACMFGYSYGFNGNPDNDPLVIAGLSRGMISQNPDWTEEMKDWHHRWLLTEKGKAWTIELGLGDTENDEPLNFDDLPLPEDN